MKFLPVRRESATGAGAGAKSRACDNPHNVTRKAPNVYRRTLARAVEIAGSTDHLASFLACTPAEIAKWSTGETSPPMPFFLAMVDITAANALTQVALENLPAARARRSTGAPAQDNR